MLRHAGDRLGRLHLRRKSPRGVRKVDVLVNSLDDHVPFPV